MKLNKQTLKKVIKEMLESEFDLFHKDIERSFMYMASKDAIFKGNLQQFVAMTPDEREKIVENIKQKMGEWQKPYDKTEKDIEF